MADKTFTCKLITPEARVLDTAATYASVPMHDGQFGVMHQTSAVVGKLGPGQFRVDMPGGQSRSWFIEGGFMQNVGDTLTVLASGATPVSELNAEEARAELAEANARKPADASQMDAITEARRVAQARVAAARK
ncbi:MAG: F0F1 ATP synthase subunit epsilon [Phycisphaerales bacterium]|nr:F0F1 ATP synthase subunit epsilon [Phycisphaerales bacterium]